MQLIQFFVKLFHFGSIIWPCFCLHWCNCCCFFSRKCRTK